MSSVSLDAQTTPADLVRRAIRESDLLRAVAAARQALASPQARGMRALKPDEIEALKAQHNAADDWSHVWVAPRFNPHKVVGCYFSGEVQLGVFRERVTLEPGVKIGSGVYNCDLNNVIVCDNAFLSNTSLIANYYIGAGAIVQGCGRVACTGRTPFGNGRRCSLGLETGGRETATYAEITVEVAAQIAAYRKREVLAAYEAAVAEYVELALSDVGVIEAGASIQNTPRVLNVYAGPESAIDAATCVENAALLSSPDETVFVGNGACVTNSVVQWGARIDSHAVVDDSVCCEQSVVDTHGTLRHSLLGPNSGISGGECSYSLVGPFVGFHHQSLLIAAYWPAGKGNIGYGANVGANHTGKAPDQEIWPGEGMFFGLGVNIKFPADFSKAPYSIIAAAVSTLPQRVEMPFSLINVRAESIEGISPAYNEILPGWVLSDDIYAVRRNERKYAVRNRASRAAPGFEVFRPEIVDLLVKARAALLKAASPAPVASALSPIDSARRPVYTDKDIPGIGKNFMKETARLEGIDAYTFYIRMYALKGLYFALKFVLSEKMDPAKALTPGAIRDPRYEHEQSLLLAEFPNPNLKDLLHELIAASEKLAADTLLTKEKDDFRGVRIVPDYAAVHAPARDDTFVRITQKETEELKKDIAEMLAIL